MPEKILGIDIGSSTIKVVQVARTLRSSQVSAYDTVKLPEDREPSQIASALVDLISEKNLQSDRYRVALSTDEVFLRRLRFPFTAQRKIAQVIEFELEPTLPLPLGEVEVDFVKTERHQDGTQGVIAAAFAKEVLNPMLSALKEAGVEPEVVDLDGSGLTFIVHELQQHLPERVVVLDIGHRKTNLLYQNRGKETYLRSLMVGCAQLASTIAEGSGISVDEALETGAVISEVACLAREVELSLMAAKVQDSELGPEMVVLTGGGSLIHGLAAALEDTLGIQVRCLGELEGLGSLAQFQDHSTDPAVFSVAAALAFKGPSRRFGFNFQAKEILSQNPLVKWRRQLIYALVACALVAFSWLGSMAIDIYTKKQRLDRLEQNIEEVFHRTVPEFKGSVRSSQYASIVKNKINQLNQSVSLFGTDIGHHSTVELLRIVSAAVPQDLDVTLNLLTVDSQRVRLSGRADGFNTVDGVKNRLMALDQFDRVTITGAKAAADGQGVQFGLELLRQQLTGESS